MSEFQKSKLEIPNFRLLKLRNVIVFFSNISDLNFKVFEFFLVNLQLFKVKHFFQFFGRKFKDFFFCLKFTLFSVYNAIIQSQEYKTAQSK